jgi:hypothetical protein
MVVLTYVAELNPEGLYFEGVPLRDLTDADLARQPAHIQAAVLAAPFYQAVATPTAVVDAADRLSRRRGAVETKEIAAAGAAAPHATEE